MDLRAQYALHIGALNERRFDELASFVAPDAVHNGSALGVDGYRRMLQDDVATSPDLFFDVVHLAVEDDLVAARIRFDVTPVAPFRGFAPTGAAVQFTEHVFYRYSGGLIREVFSLIDDEALGRHLPRSGS